MRLLSRLLPVLLCFALIRIASAGSPDPPAHWESLFNGIDLKGWHGRPHYRPDKLAAMSEEERQKTLDGWMKETVAHWTVDNGELVNDGKGPYLTTNREFGDFEMTIDYKTVAKADSGIYLRGNPQVQIWDYTRDGGKWNRAADKGSGGLFNNAKRAPGQEPLVLADKPFGEWNSFRIIQLGSRTSVWLNDKLVVDRAIMENYWDRSRPHVKRGPIQLQTHGGEIRWRNIRINELHPEETNSRLRQESGFEQIFNGKDFTGWQGDTDSYEVVNGAIVCKAGKGGNLFTKDEYDDFKVRFDFKLPPGGNNGLAIRYPGEGQPHVSAMCELQVLDNTAEKYKDLHATQYHGSAYGMVPAHRGFLRPAGEWNHQVVTVKGSTIQVELNGFPILDADLSLVEKTKDGPLHDGVKRTNGFFGFAGHNDPVAFRNIEIKRLSRDEINVAAWPQFRGHNSSGVAATRDALPTKIGPDTKNIVWKQPLPPGHSSPVIYEDRIYMTGVKDEKLVTFALNRENGEVLWEAEAPHKKLEEIHQIGSHAQCSPVTDGEIVVSLFGSTGLFAYDLDGNELWNIPMGPFNNDFGAGTSPIIVDDKVILVQDHDTDSFLLAVNKKTGKEIWKTDRSEFPRNYCSPIVWEFGGKKQVVVAATLRVVGYDLERGKEVWTVRGLSRAVCMTPVVGEDNNLYVAGWARGGDVDERISIPEWEEAHKLWDKNKNNTLERDELEKGGPIERRYPQIDRDKTGTIAEKEYRYYQNLFEVARNVVMSIKPGGTGDLTGSNVRWEYRKFLPFCASPLYAHDYVYTVKDGGILTSISARTGDAIKTGRLTTGNKNYYASPVAGDNKVYLVDQAGNLTVVSSFAEWTELWSAEFGEEVYGTPAIVQGQIFLRTNGHLYCFANK